MSYDVQAFMVDAEKIENIWGSKDEIFLNNFLKKNKKIIEEETDYFEIDVCVYRKCMHDIVNGKIQKKLQREYDYIYGYLYKLLCLEFGEYVGHECFLSFLYDVTKKQYKAFIPIPKNSDWPQFHSIKHKDLEKGRKIFLNNKEEYAQEEYYIEAVNLIFDTASKNKKDLVFIGH